jgi:oxygen-independent coproporphyrinogen-3 oxidase
VIYVHVPFCRSFCTYCDFYSEVAGRCRKAEDARKQEALFEDFAQALACEVRSRAGEITDDVNTLYIGGGTPSVLPLSAFKTLLSVLDSVGHSGPFEEFTVEVNPEDIVDKGQAYVEGLLELGVNRISMGVQSFDDSVLKFMNRRHDSATARKAYAIIEDAGVKNISIDLIFGLPQLSSSQWSETLNRALDISSRGVLPQHISSYQLSVEPGSMLARLVEKGSWSEASDELCQEQYLALCSVLASAGYHHYEISNFAQPGFEARHNSAYWNHVPYVGLGPGAHSFISLASGRVADHHTNCSRTWNRPDLQSYLSAAKAGDFSIVCDGETLDSDQLVLERIMLGLRTSTGLPESYLRANCAHSVLSQALAAGHLVSVGPNLRIPESNFFISDSIISSLV